MTSESEISVQCSSQYLIFWRLSHNGYSIILRSCVCWEYPTYLCHSVCPGAGWQWWVLPQIQWPSYCQTGQVPRLGCISNIIRLWIQQILGIVTDCGKFRIEIGSNLALRIMRKEASDAVGLGNTPENITRVRAEMDSVPRNQSKFLFNLKTWVIVQSQRWFTSGMPWAMWLLWGEMDTEPRNQSWFLFMFSHELLPRKHINGKTISTTLSHSRHFLFEVQTITL